MKNLRKQNEVIEAIQLILGKFKGCDIFDDEDMAENNMSLDNFRDEISDGRLELGFGLRAEFSVEDFDKVLNRILSYSHK